MVDPRATPWSVASDDVVEAVDADASAGLTSAEAARRLERDGLNELAESEPESLLHRAAKQFADPLVGLLLAAIVISLLAWWSDGAEGYPVESIVIALIIIANAGVGVWQEGRAIDAVAALRRLAALHTTVTRDGRTSSIVSTGVVVGDLVVLAEGDAVCADARVVQSNGLEVSEAALTGESLAVAKTVDRVESSAVIGDRTNMVFSGTAVTRGRATCVVTATGHDTEVGRIAELLEQSVSERTPLQRQIDQLSKWLGLAVLVLAVVVVAAILLTSDVTSSGDVLDALVVAVSLAVAAVPEGLPAIMTVVLALGVQRMAGHDAIVKRLLSVETLGAASVICSDKTGTLTRNEMTVVRLSNALGSAEINGVGYTPTGEISLRPDVADGAGDRVMDRDVATLLSGAAAANDASLQRRSENDPSSVDEWTAVGDPTEIALLVAAAKHGSAGAIETGERVDEVSFDSDRKLMSTLHGPRPDGWWEQYTKGAPDVLADRCTHELRAGEPVALTDDARRRIGATIDDYADRGLRTLAIARRRHAERPVPFDTACEHDLVLLGIVGIADPARDEVLPVIAEAERAGVKIVMITGDHPRTARAIGRDLGMSVAPNSVITGTELEASDVSGDVVERATVFARVTPEDKLDIVRAYQESGHVVAMTGDGVNDAPALRQADIGVAMGRGGTEVARDAADMILADDNFGTIVHAIREGREIFADIRKFLRYLLASNFGEVLVMILGVLAAAPIGLAVAGDGLAVPLLATQILWINLLTDSTLALALGVDPSVDDVMASPPRGLESPIIDGAMWVTIALVGATTALAGLVALDLGLAGGMLGGSGDLTSARTMLFTTVVVAQIFNAFNSRSDLSSAFVDPFGNRLLWGAAGLTLALQAAVVHLPPLNRAFDTTPLSVGQWAICLGLSSTVLVVDELRKFVAARRRAGADG